MLRVTPSDIFLSYFYILNGNIHLCSSSSILTRDGLVASSPKILRVISGNHSKGAIPN